MGWEEMAMIERYVRALGFLITRGLARRFPKLRTRLYFEAIRSAWVPGFDEWNEAVVDLYKLWYGLGGDGDETMGVVL